MADQPDWQLYQSSAATFLYNETSATPAGIQNKYIGPYRTLFFNASDSGNGDVWDALFTFANDAARTQIVQQVPIILGTGFAFAGFIPVLAPYLTIGVSNTVPAAGQNFTGSVLPLLSDPPSMGRFLPRTMISTVEQNMNHANFANIGANFYSAGPARLTLRSTGHQVTYDLQVMASNGTWSTVKRYQTAERDHSQTFDVTLPYNPVRLQVTNNEPFQQITFDAVLETL